MYMMFFLCALCLCTLKGINAYVSFLFDFK